MTDVVDRKTRSRMMSGIRGKNTKPELLIRKGLYHKGFRYRLHDKELAGMPDMVLRKFRAVIFIHGCFWHRHNCRLFKWPQTRTEFWRNKLDANHQNDIKVIQSLRSAGWRVCVVWECALKGADKDINSIVSSIANWLEEKEETLDISG